MGGLTCITGLLHRVLLGLLICLPFRYKVFIGVFPLISNTVACLGPKFLHLPDSGFHPFHPIG